MPKLAVKNNHLTRCKCGSTEFGVCETTQYRARVGEDGTLQAYSCQDNSIDCIICWNCCREYPASEFQEITFDF